MDLCEWHWKDVSITYIGFKFPNSKTKFIFFSDDGRTKPVPRVEATANKEEPEYSCIFRATLASKKISTIVNKSFLFYMYLEQLQIFYSFI